MADIIKLHADAFRPVDFSMSAEKAMAARADAEMATVLLTWAQEARETALRGGMTAPRRLLLLEAVGILMDHPRVT
jgi:hypothetical protein